jgi:hypothetical protein
MSAAKTTPSRTSSESIKQTATGSVPRVSQEPSEG